MEILPFPVPEEEPSDTPLPIGFILIAAQILARRMREQQQTVVPSTDQATDKAA